LIPNENQDLSHKFDGNKSKIQIVTTTRNCLRLPKLYFNRPHAEPTVSKHLRSLRCVKQGDHSPDNVKFHDISLTVHGTPGLLPILSVTHIMPVLVLLSVVGVGMQQCMILNQNEMHKLSKVKNGCKYTANNKQFQARFFDKIFSVTISKIPDISLTAVKFPDISRFSRQVVTLEKLQEFIRQLVNNHVNYTSACDRAVLTAGEGCY